MYRSASRAPAEFRRRAHEVEEGATLAAIYAAYEDQLAEMGVNDFSLFSHRTEISGRNPRHLFACSGAHHMQFESKSTGNCPPTHNRGLMP